MFFLGLENDQNKFPDEWKVADTNFLFSSEGWKVADIVFWLKLI